MLLHDENVLQVETYHRKIVSATEGKEFDCELSINTIFQLDKGISKTSNQPIDCIEDSSCIGVYVICVAPDEESMIPNESHFQ